MKIKQNINEIAICQTKNGAITLKQDASADMLWASQNQIADIFEVKRPAAYTMHLIHQDKTYPRYNTAAPCFPMSCWEV